MTAFEIRRAADINAQPEEHRWLIEGLWSTEAVGVIGGEPKSCKSFLALDIAVSVASGQPCLRRFAVHHPGPVLLFAAEDALHIVRERLEGIAAVAGVDFRALDVHAITAPAVRLDLERDRRRLRETVETLRPKLLVLDPFVRLHSCDENQASEVAPLLAYLRELQRAFATAVLLVHHARKARHVRAGQALRGSSEIHAWGDSNLYLRRSREQIVLTIEHRSAPSSTKGIVLALRADRNAVALQIVDDEEPAHLQSLHPPSAVERVQRVLAASAAPLDLRALRAACRMRTATLCAAVAELKQQAVVLEVDGGYSLS